MNPRFSREMAQIIGTNRVWMRLSDQQKAEFRQAVAKANSIKELCEEHRAIVRDARADLKKLAKK